MFILHITPLYYRVSTQSKTPLFINFFNTYTYNLGEGKYRKIHGQLMGNIMGKSIFNTFINTSAISCITWKRSFTAHLNA